MRMRSSPFSSVAAARRSLPSSPGAGRFLRRTALRLRFLHQSLDLAGQAGLEKGENRSLLGPQARQALLQLGLDLLADLDEQRPFEIGGEDLGMDIALAAD